MLRLNIIEVLSNLDSLFVDTAPIIYHIEAHETFGPLTKEVISFFQAEKRPIFTSVITVTEVLPVPVSLNNEEPAKKFVSFLKKGKNINLLEISSSIAEHAGRLRGKYNSLRTMDALQVASAVYAGADAFLTNDVRLKQVKEEIDVIVMRDYVE